MFSMAECLVSVCDEKVSLFITGRHSIIIHVSYSSSSSSALTTLLLPYWRRNFSETQCSTGGDHSQALKQKYTVLVLACSISMVTKLPTQAVCIFVALYISIFVPLFLYQCTLYRCNFVFLPMYFVSWFLCIFVCFFLLLRLYFYCFFLLLYLSGIFFISFFLKSTVFLQPFCSTVLNYENQSGQRLILSETQCLE